MAAVGIPDAQMAQPAALRDSSPAINGKRKRDDENSGETNNSKASINQDELYGLTDDLIYVLESTFDLAPVILTRPFPIPSTNKDMMIKRTKLSPSPPPQTGKTEMESDADVTSIRKRLNAKAYQNIDELTADFDTVFKMFLTNSDGTTRQETAGSDVVKQARLIQDEVHGLLGVEKRRHGQSDAPAGTDGEAGGVLNSAKSTGDSQIANGDTSSQSSFILTTFGADYKGRGPSRQWFASRQIPPSTATTPDPVETANLPVGVNATLMQDTSRPTFRNPLSKQSLGDLIPAPSKALALRPPRPIMSGTTRSRVVEWHKPPVDLPLHRPRNDDSWINSMQPVGEWLSYGGYSDMEESVAEKRMKRNRTLSGGERPDAAEVEFLQQSKLSRARARKTSLFRSAFSSFAPSHDDTGAIVPAATRARLWWIKTGSEIYNSYENPQQATQSLEEQLQALDPRLLEGEERVSEEEMKVIDEAVEKGYLDEEMPEVDEKAGDRTVEELLEDVSENIETLINYQQDRMKVIASPGKPSIIQHPSMAEEETYETLKLYLASITAMLPPAAVSRLDGDKLKRLNISTDILLNIPSSSGNFDMADKSQPARPTPTQHTPQPPRPIQQPRSAYAGQSGSMNRPAMPPQYSVPQQSRFAGQMQGTTAQGSPLPNGYPRPMPPNYQQPGYSGHTNSPANTPSRPSGQYAVRPPQGYQSRLGPYQHQQPPSPQVPNNSGRAGSPQRPPSYNTPPTRTPYGVASGSNPAPGPTPNLSLSASSQASLSAGHAASIYHPPSNGSSAPQASQGTIGALVNVSAEEQQQMDRRAHEKQAPQQQDQLRQAGGSPSVSQKPPPQMVMTPQSQKHGAPMTNGAGPTSPSPSKMQGIQQSHSPQQNVNMVNGS